MPQRDAEHPDTEDVVEQEVEECEKGDHLSDLDEHTKRFLSTFSTIRSKLEDLSRAESDVKRFELSIETERKRLQKQLENAKIGLRSARVQMAVELGKLDEAGFQMAAKLIKDNNVAV